MTSSKMFHSINTTTVERHVIRVGQSRSISTVFEMPELISTLIAGFWSASAATALATTVVPSLAALSSYGKLTAPESIKQKVTPPPTFFQSLASLQLPCSFCFKSYYWIGQACLIAIWLKLAGLISFPAAPLPVFTWTSPDHVLQSVLTQVGAPTALTLALLHLHITTRLYECYFVHESTPFAQQSIVVFVFGKMH